jgi:hypothetical protein
LLLSLVTKARKKRSKLLRSYITPPARRAGNTFARNAVGEAIWDFPELHSLSRQSLVLSADFPLKVVSSCNASTLLDRGLIVSSTGTRVKEMKRMM